MEKLFTVYCHKNKINGKVYIGITSNHTKRWTGNGTAYKGCKHFYSAILKYGWDNFEHIILKENLTKEEVCLTEIELIKQYKSTDRTLGYNVSHGGDAFMSGYKFSEEQRNNLSKLKKGKYKGRHFSEKSEYKIGHGFSEEALIKMANAKIGKPSWNKGLLCYISGEKNPMKRDDVKLKHTGSNNGMARKIYQFTKDNEFVKEWDCMTDAARHNQVHIGNITKCCKGELRTTGGYNYKYAS